MSLSPPPTTGARVHLNQSKTLSHSATKIDSMELKDGHVTAPRLLQELSGLKLFGNILEVLKTKLRAVVEPGP